MLFDLQNSAVIIIIIIIILVLIVPPRQQHAFHTAPNMQLATVLLNLSSTPAATASRIAQSLCRSCLDVSHEALSASVMLLYNVLDAADVITDLLHFAQQKSAANSGDVSGLDGHEAVTHLSKLSLLQAVQLQGTLLGALVPVGLQELQSEHGALGVVDRLLASEHYALAVYVAKRCGLDARPAWLQWTCALLRYDKATVLTQPRAIIVGLSLTTGCRTMKLRSASLPWRLALPLIMRNRWTVLCKNSLPDMIWRLSFVHD